MGCYRDLCHPSLAVLPHRRSHFLVAPAEKEKVAQRLGGLLPVRLSRSRVPEMFKLSLRPSLNLVGDPWSDFPFPALDLTERGLTYAPKDCGLVLRESKGFPIRFDSASRFH